MRQEHNEYNKSEFDDGGRSIDEKAFFQVLDEWGFEYEMEMWGLQADEGAQEVQSLYAILFLHKQLIKSKQNGLGLLDVY